MSCHRSKLTPALYGVLLSLSLLLTAMFVRGTYCDFVLNKSLNITEIQLVLLKSFGLWAQDAYNAREFETFHP